MGLKLEYNDAQTPIDEDEKDGLLISSITTHRELDEHEQLNIENALQWVSKSKFSNDEILTETFIRKLHKRMFGEVWAWAGSFRRSEKNIGVDWINIVVELRKLIDDMKFWIENEIYTPDETTIRFKHRLVKIHCFPNGNGRHSRILADIIVDSIFGKPYFTWHRINMIKPDEMRKKYIEALREADKGNIALLVNFARS